MKATVDVPWAVTPEKVNAVVQRLREAARPRKIILLGSYVHGEIHRDSDLDVLVVTDDSVENLRAESVRLRRCMADIDMPMDILVVPESRFNPTSRIRSPTRKNARWSAGFSLFLAPQTG